MNKLIDIYELATMFTNVSNSYFKQFNANIRIEVTDSAKIIGAMFNDEIGDRMIWCVCEKQLDKIVTQLLPWFDINCNDHFSDRYNNKILDTLFLHIHDIVNTFVPLRTWHMYECHVRNFDIMVIKGIDFRIYDWERRRYEGEFLLDKHRVNKDLWGTDRIKPRDVTDKRYDSRGNKKWQLPLSLKLDR